MAEPNKSRLDLIVEALVAHLAKELTGEAGVLDSVQTDVIDPLSAPEGAVLAVVQSRWRRHGGPVASPAWTCELLLQLSLRRSRGTVSWAVGKVDAAIEALIASGQAGANIDKPTWDAWHNIAKGGLAKIGAMATLSVHIAGPLVTEPILE